MVNTGRCPPKTSKSLSSAFEMGIGQPDVDMVIQVDVPPSLEQLLQEFGCVGRDGRLCKGIVLYHESDL